MNVKFANLKEEIVVAEKMRLECIAFSEAAQARCEAFAKRDILLVDEGDEVFLSGGIGFIPITHLTRWNLVVTWPWVGRVLVGKTNGVERLWIVIGVVSVDNGCEAVTLYEPAFGSFSAHHMSDLHKLGHWEDGLDKPKPENSLPQTDQSYVVSPSVKAPKSAAEKAPGLDAVRWALRGLNEDLEQTQKRLAQVTQERDDLRRRLDAVSVSLTGIDSATYTYYELLKATQDGKANDGQ